jgi:hypothetical protein
MQLWNYTKPLHGHSLFIFDQGWNISHGEALFAEAIYTTRHEVIN